jgi:hypothetical protein
VPKSTSIFPRGHFFQQLGGAHRADPKAMIAERGFFGLTRSATFLFSCLRSEDGALFENIRRFSHHNRNVAERGASVEESLKKPSSTLMFQSTLLDGENLRFDYDKMQAQARSDDVVVRMENDKAVWESASDAEGRPFRISFGPDSCAWTEEGLFSLKGTMLKPGLHWYLPGRDYGTYYVSNLFRLEGEIGGQCCTGIVGFDQSYMGEGGNLYSHNDLIFESSAHISWYTWANCYADGSYECGHFLLASGSLGFALFTDGHTTTFTQDVTGWITPRPDSIFPARIDLLIDGESWEFTPDPRGKMIDMARGHPPAPEQEGQWQRVGDTRKPVVWFASGDTTSSGELMPAPRLPTEPEIV